MPFDHGSDENDDEGDTTTYDGDMYQRSGVAETMYYT